MLAIYLCLALLANAEPLRVVCFGDSTTAPRAGVVTYCDILRTGGYDALNKGVPGNTTDDARRRFQSAVIDTHPAVVIIQFGLNDSTVDVWKSPPATAARVPIGRYRENLRYFVQAARASGIRVILMTFNPVTWTPKLTQLYGKPPYHPAHPEGFEAGRGEYLDAVRAITREFNTQFLDARSIFSGTADKLLPDGMHPNSEAHQRIAAGLLPLLRP